MKGKLGHKIIFEAGKTLWPIVLTFNLPMLLYPYPYRHLQYSPKLLKHLSAFPLPQCCLGYSSCLSAPKVRVTQQWGRRGAHFSENKGAKSEYHKFARKFRNTVSVSTISNGYCR